MQYTTTLYLDYGMRPLREVSWQKAITDLFKGKTEVVKYSRDQMIRGITQDYPFPRVVRVLRTFKREKLPIKFSRINVYVRDEFTCQYCCKVFETEDLTYDHVLPRRQGGKTEWTNIVTACRSCNAAKADRTPEQAKMKLLKKPVKPRFLANMAEIYGMNRKEIPEDFREYWTVTLTDK